MASISNDPRLAELQGGAIPNLSGEPEFDRTTEDAIQVSGGLGGDRGAARDQFVDVLNGEAGPLGQFGEGPLPIIQEIGNGLAGR